MKMYLYDEETGVYVGEKEAAIDEFTSLCKGEIVYALEACSTWIKPVFKDGYTTVWNGREGAWSFKPLPTEQEIQDALEKEIEAWMNSVVAEKHYDSIDTCIARYTDSPNPQYAAEAKAVKAWNTAVWDKCWDILAEVKTGTRPIPSLEEVIYELPKLEW